MAAILLPQQDLACLPGWPPAEGTNQKYVQEPVRCPNLLRKKNILERALAACQYLQLLQSRPTQKCMRPTTESNLPW